MPLQELHVQITCITPLISGWNLLAVVVLAIEVEHVSNFVLKDSMFQGQGSNRIALVLVAMWYTSPIAWFNEQRSRECKSTETVDGHSEIA